MINYCYCRLHLSYKLFTLILSSYYGAEHVPMNAFEFCFLFALLDNSGGDQILHGVHQDPAHRL